MLSQGNSNISEESEYHFVEELEYQSVSFWPLFSEEEGCKVSITEPTHNHNYFVGYSCRVKQIHLLLMKYWMMKYCLSALVTSGIIKTWESITILRGLSFLWRTIIRQVTDVFFLYFLKQTIYFQIFIDRWFSNFLRQILFLLCLWGEGNYYDFE